QAPGLQTAHTVGPQLNPRAYLAECCGALKKPYIPASMRGSKCGRQAADAATRQQQLLVHAKRPPAGATCPAVTPSNFQQLAQHEGQYAASFVVVHLDRRIDTQRDAHLFA